MHRHFLILDSEAPIDRAGRRADLGQSSAESFAATLRQLHSDCEIEFVVPAEGDTISADDAHAFDAVFLSGSPIHAYDKTPEVGRIVDAMRAVFASGTPSFGSCAGLHIAVVAAGGTVRPMQKPMEAGIARRITATAAGLRHPLLTGRAAAWDAPAIHGDEVDVLPEGCTILATNGVSSVQAAEIVFGPGTFWGVQYHPELSPGEIAAGIRRQAAELVSAGIADDEECVQARAEQLDALQDDPVRVSTKWLLGVDDEFADVECRRRELSNFIAALPRLRNSG